jgi:hypothetical protein
VARVVIVSNLRSKGSAKSGKIGDLAQDSYLEFGVRLEFGCKIQIRRTRAEPLDGSVRLDV